jgi:hypothetical protein
LDNQQKIWIENLLNDLAKEISELKVEVTEGKNFSSEAEAEADSSLRQIFNDGFKEIQVNLETIRSTIAEMYETAGKIKKNSTEGKGN